MTEEELVPYKLSDILRSGRVKNRLEKGRNRKNKNKNRRNNRAARKNRRLNLRRGNVGGKQ